MPVDASIANKIWGRYAWCRDNGHSKYVAKADICERMFAGDQWDPVDRAVLAAVRRPALTINKILSTVGNVLGEQIYNRSEISFRPRNGGSAGTADVLNKVFKQISDNNQLDWRRSDMFADGIIGSRGYLDIRLCYNDQLQGEVRYENINPKNVIVDPDAEEYDPDSWSEVFITKWVTADDIATLYNEEDAEILRGRGQSVFPYGYDSIESARDRFGERLNPSYAGGIEDMDVARNIRLIERQFRTLDKQKHFVERETGDMRAIPKEFDRNRIAFFVEKFGFAVTTKLVRRIKWTVIADNVVLHDEFSPYKHFTVVPYFPHFRHGNTIGLVENLAGPQELLNKVTSQELHVLNTSANSGYKVKAGNLVNMSIEELEQKGAQTGIVLEVQDMDGLEKIQPNNTPQGLDRMSFKAEESIKTISGVSDSAQGFDREDVAAKAIEAKKKANSVNLVKPLDNLGRTDFFIARNTLDLVQEFYTEQRIITMVDDPVLGTTKNVTINEVDPDTGNVVNDLMLGEYHAVITSVPHRETLEDSQFEHAKELRELGIQIPDAVLIDASRLQNKKDVIKQIEAASQTPEAKQKAELGLRGLAAEVQKTEAEGGAKQADAGLKQAKTQETLINNHLTATGQGGDGGAGGQADLMKATAEIDLNERKFEHEQVMDAQELHLKDLKDQRDASIKAHDVAQKRADARAAAAKEAAAGKVSYKSPA